MVYKPQMFVAKSQVQARGYKGGLKLLGETIGSFIIQAETIKRSSAASAASSSTARCMAKSKCGIRIDESAELSRGFRRYFWLH